MCTEDGALYVTNRDGSDTGNYLRKDQMVSLGLADTGVVTIDFHVEKDDECDDHFVYLLIHKPVPRLGLELELQGG